MENLLKYYSRKDVQKAILEISRNRESIAKFGEASYGKRPDVIHFENDIYELAKKGATSFHISEEHWSNPLLIKTGMAKKELDNLRIGWDLILDVDGITLEYSKLAAYYIVEVLKFYDIKNISIKFSGNKGFHIGIPFEAFPKNVNQIEIRNFFPEGPRILAEYIKSMIKEHLMDTILEKETLNHISDKLKKPKESLLKNNFFDPFTLVNIDSVLISSRHLFRAPYSYHEKSGLISIPIKSNNILNFNIEQAKIENVQVKLKFLDASEVKNPEAADLFDKALYWNLKQTKQEITIKNIKSEHLQISTSLINEQFFPPCIQLISNGMKEDGRKRALFILLNFLKSTGYSHEQIEKYILEWDKKNYKPLRENYLKAQLTWYKKQQKSIPPPNCPARENNIPNINQQNYYTDLRICHPDNLCKLIKNPVNYAIKKQRLFTKKA